jgi:hypothetical protein
MVHLWYSQKRGGFTSTSPAAPVRLPFTGRNATGIDDTCLQLPIGIESSDGVDRSDRRASNQKNRKLCRISEAKENRRESVRIG